MGNTQNGSRQVVAMSQCFYYYGTDSFFFMSPAVPNAFLLVIFLQSYSMYFLKSFEDKLSVLYLSLNQPKIILIFYFRRALLSGM